MQEQLTQVVVLGGMLFANAGAIAAAFVAVKVAIAKLEVKVDRMEKDINNLGSLYRQQNKTGEVS